MGPCNLEQCIEKQFFCEDNCLLLLRRHTALPWPRAFHILLLVIYLSSPKSERRQGLPATLPPPERASHSQHNLMLTLYPGVCK